MPNQPQGVTIDLNGVGPFEFPLCGKNVSAMTHNEKVFLLQLETADKGQQIYLPISTEALPSLKTLIDHLLNTRGLGHTKQ